MKRDRQPTTSIVILAAGLLMMLVFCWRLQWAHAAGDVPPGCVPHTTFVRGGADYPDDFRCAGTAIQFHTGGVGRSPFPIWAGQWLLVDETGGYRFGWCTFNRGIHPTIDRQSKPVTQRLPKDPTGAKLAYLTWRYGSTTDSSVATAMWAVVHYYAQDAAGSNRASNAAAPLVPSLQMLHTASGSQALEDLAASLDSEAARLAGPFSIDVRLTSDGSGSARVLAGDQPVPLTAVTLTVEGAAFDDDSPSATLVTDADGQVSFEIVGPAQTATVTAVTSIPGPVQTYQAAAADPVGHLPQTLVTAGPPGLATGAATITLEAPPTTTTETPTTVEETTTTEAPTTTETPETEAPTTTGAPTTTVEETTTTETPTTVADSITTVPETTTTPETELATTTTETPQTAAETTTSVTVEQLTPVPEQTVATTSPPEVVIPIVETETLPATTIPETMPPDSTSPETATPDTVAAPPLPHTGSSSGPAYLGTSLLVAGFGLIGVVRRRLRSTA